MNVDKLVLEPRFSKRIYNSCYQAVVSTAFAHYLGLHAYGGLGWAIMLMSLNYWRHPIKTSWRRYCDMALSGVGAFVQMYTVWARLMPHHATHRSYFLGYCFFLLGSFFFYGCARYSESENLSSGFHCCLHFMTSGSNIVLYSALASITTQVQFTRKNTTHAI